MEESSRQGAERVGTGSAGRGDDGGPAGVGRFRIAPLALCAAGAVLLVIGVTRGEAAVVLMKAVRICLECIGIG